MAYSDAVLADSPVVFYRLQETAGTVADDSSPNGFDAAYFGAPGFGAAAIIEGDARAVQFDGVDDVLGLNASGNVTAVAFEAWVKTSTATGTMLIGGRASSTQSIGYLDIASGLPRFVVQNTSSAFTVVTGPASVADGNVHHLVGTISGTTLRLYVDGAEVASGTMSGTLNGTPDLAISFGARFISGTASVTADRHFTGVMAGCAYYATALSAARVLAHYQAAMGSVVGPATEADSALGAGLTASTGRATEVDSALAITTSVLVGTAAESDVALAAGPGVGVGVALEADVARMDSAAPPLGIATETDLARDAGLTAGLGTAHESDIALFSTQMLGIAMEVDLAPAGPIQGTAQTLSFSTGIGSIVGSSALNMLILDPAQRRAPTSIQVMVTGADPFAELTFSVDGEVLWVDTADVEGELGQTSIEIPGDFAAGTWTLTVTSIGNGSDTDEFTLALPPAAADIVQEPDVDAVLIPDSADRWVFQDLFPGGLGSWVLPHNPLTMSAPHWERTLSARHTTSATSGQFIVGEGRFIGKQWRLTGYCPDQAYYDQLNAYADIERRFYVIDHRGRAWKVGVAALAIEPRKRQNDDVDPDNDWAGDWTMDLVIYDQTPSVPVGA